MLDFCAVLFVAVLKLGFRMLAMGGAGLVGWACCTVYYRAVEAEGG